MKSKSKRRADRQIFTNSKENEKEQKSNSRDFCLLLCTSAFSFVYTGKLYSPWHQHTFLFASSSFSAFVVLPKVIISILYVCFRSQSVFIEWLALCFARYFFHLLCLVLSYFMFCFYRVRVSQMRVILSVPSKHNRL